MATKVIPSLILILTIAIAVIVVTVVTGTFEPAATPTPTPTLTPTPAATLKVQLLHHSEGCELISGYCDCHITGVAKNTSDADVSEVFIKVEFFDSLNKKLNTWSEYIGDLGPAQSVNFDVPYYGEQCPDHYEIWTEWEYQ
ncbi:MAG: FxLYD domain-containing protein [Dehalococcoidia bacterium]